MNPDAQVQIHNLGFSPHPLLTLPDGGARVWRYMDLAKFVSMLQNEALYFPVIAELGDDLEAAPPRVPADADELMRMRAFGDWSFGRCLSFASCWHLAEDESAAMWNIYAGRNQGIAAQSTVKSLTEAFPRVEHGNLGKTVTAGLVEYIDPDVEELPPFVGNTYTQIVRKRQWYSYENEFRLLCAPLDNWEEPVTAGEPGKFKQAGVWVRCRLLDAIQSVVVAPKAPPYLQSAVSEIFSRFGYDPKIVMTSRLEETVRVPNMDAYRAAMNSLFASANQAVSSDPADGSATTEGRDR